jgi:hypothetical protein
MKATKATYKWAAALLAAALALGMAACNQGNDDASEEIRQLQLYYVNGAFIESGDDSLGRLIGPVDVNIVVDASGGTDEMKYGTLLESLRDVPDVDEAEGAVSMVSGGIMFGEAKFANGTAYVDVLSETAGGEPLSGGSLEEVLLLEQITFSMIDSFEEVENVQFLVDGQQADTLMGQMDISEPFDEGSFGDNSI